MKATKRFGPLSHRQDPSKLGRLYHGSLEPERLKAEGFCMPAIADPENKSLGLTALADPEWFIENEAPPEIVERVRATRDTDWPSPAAIEWQRNEMGTRDFDWRGVWRFEVWHWFTEQLDGPESRKLLKLLGLPSDLGGDRETEVDLLGMKISLLWVSTSRKSAVDFAGSAFRVDFKSTNALGYFVDAIYASLEEENDRTYVIVFPAPDLALCPQVPPEALR